MRLALGIIPFLLIISSCGGGGGSTEGDISSNTDSNTYIISVPSPGTNFLKQDLICCSKFDEDGTCLEYSTPITRKIDLLVFAYQSPSITTTSTTSTTFTESTQPEFTPPSNSQESTSSQSTETTEETTTSTTQVSPPILCERCTIKFVPNQFLPEEAKTETLLQELSSYTSCFCSDLLPIELDKLKEDFPIISDYSQIFKIRIEFSNRILETIKPIWESLGKETLTYTVEVNAEFTIPDENKTYTKKVLVPIDFNDFKFHPGDACPTYSGDATDYVTLVEQNGIGVPYPTQ